MKKELIEAANYIALYLKDAGYSDNEIKCFSVYFTEYFENRYRLYWFPENSIRASAYRSIQILAKRHIDPVFAKIFELSKLNLNAFLSIIPQEFTVWIDPGCVSVRVGDRNAPIVSIFTSDTNVFIQNSFHSNRRDKQQFNVSKINNSHYLNRTFSNDVFKNSYYPLISNPTYSHSLTNANQLNYSPCISENSFTYSNDNSKELSNKISSAPVSLPAAAVRIVQQSNNTANQPVYVSSSSSPSLQPSVANSSPLFDNSFNDQASSRVAHMKNCRMSFLNDVDYSREYFYFNDVLYNSKVLSDWELTRIGDKVSHTLVQANNQKDIHNSHSRLIIQLLQNDPLFQMHMNDCYAKFDMANTSADEIRTGISGNESAFCKTPHNLIIPPVHNENALNNDTMFQKLSSNSLYPIPIYE